MVVMDSVMVVDSVATLTVAIRLAVGLSLSVVVAAIRLAVGSNLSVVVAAADLLSRLVRLCTTRIIVCSCG
jgi:hypothetical protein